MRKTAILFIEDAIVADTISDVLSEAGLITYTALTEETAQELLVVVKPDFLLMDYWKGTVQQCKDLVEFTKNHWKMNPHIILITSDIRFENVIDSVDVHAILPKPFDLDALSRAILL